MHDHERFIKEAIKLAIENVPSGKGGPFGAVIVKDGEIIARGQNMVTSTNDPTAHAEIVAIREACMNLEDFQLTGCIIYSSCELCPMCLGAIYWARPEMIVFAADNKDANKAGFDDSIIYREINLPLPERKIPALNIKPDNFFAPFQLWIDHEIKKPY
jgi:guanine deaminase